jgi:hypothetical protein
MRPVTVEVEVAAPRSEVWSVISDIEGSAGTLSGVEEVEVLERPERGLRGLKWRETRNMYGKRAIETMWISAADEGTAYEVEARSHGSVYRTRVELGEAAHGTRLGMRFSAQPLTLAARLLTLLFGRLIARSVRAALMQDLLDIKAAAEMRQRSGGKPATPAMEAP